MQALFLVLAYLLALNASSGLAQSLIPDWQKVAILNVFNEARRTTVLAAADMKMLVWDENIAAQAQVHTDKCQRTWGRLNGAALAYIDRMPNPVAVAKWRTLRMAPYYDYQTGGCINTAMSNATCRHPQNYESIVFASTERVGCGMSYCFPDEGPKAWFHACAIDAPVRRPRFAWTVGERCSKCPAGWNYCLEGLCSRTPPTPRPSQNPTTSKPSRNPTKFPTKRSRAPTRFPTRKPTP